jgi:hypothetical protein
MVKQEDIYYLWTLELEIYKMKGLYRTLNIWLEYHFINKYSKYKINIHRELYWMIFIVEKIFKAMSINVINVEAYPKRPGFTKKHTGFTQAPKCSTINNGYLKIRKWELISRHTWT